MDIDWKEAGRQSRIALLEKFRQTYADVIGDEFPELLDYLSEMSIPEIRFT